ncbi:peptide chain release factor N(5)-glutamine methyltransferase [Albimonas sp. CAU 1670]|uniref:peptide chain release factor N(5)-glutamine methyltransferase n=1 Tax=Albimonas sp. CAU 1670 TaxID=3032599 RepID=UPI0023D9FCDD|nr:peptide chain release factor N(5)-glutamine methyltransferase [Albimonas sp. CAU 1670]MDF2234518.1 peptide chain release factor N(5)-glutamine methyltransferase [Albimonas sp. CAU 1670]
MSAPATRAGQVAEGVRMLQAAGVADPARDARLLARWASGLEAAAFAARMDEPPTVAEAARFAAGLGKRAARQPMSQIMGAREFWGRRFEVGPDVLDPRPETETLIAAALEGPAPRRILDLGLGSGCILLTLLAEWPQASGLGIERSEPALATARRNAVALGLDGRAQMQPGDWFAGVRGRFELVVSNPPYIPEQEVEALDPEVRGWEPFAALSGGADGLGAYRAIAAGLDGALAPGGRAILEIGAGQEGDVEAIFAAQGFVLHAAHRDFDDRPRALEFRRPEDADHGRPRQF